MRTGGSIPLLLLMLGTNQKSSSRKTVPLSDKIASGLPQRELLPQFVGSSGIQSGHTIYLSTSTETS